ncbi:MAG TPA: ATP synthase F1 subunit delta [Pirellulales bacterium]
MADRFQIQEPAKNKPEPQAIDVGAQRVAALYAKAFLAAAEKSHHTDALVEELAGLADLFSQQSDFAAVLASALVSQEEKSQLLDTILGGKVSDTLLDFLKVLSRHERLDLVRPIEREVVRMYDELRGRVLVHVRTATPVQDGLSQSLRDSLSKLFGGEAKIEAEVDPALIGGIMLRVGDTVYDGSLARQLEQVREQMITRSVHEIQS